jgi:diadenylate cyclase
MPEWSDLIYWSRSVLEILIITVVIYQLLLALERISAGGKLRGLSLTLSLVVVAWMVARLAQFHAITWLLQAGIGVSAVVMAVVFQPELRRLFTRLGGFFPNQDLSVNASIVGDLLDAVAYMSSRRIGALIVIERGDRLDEYVNSSPLDCEVTSKAVTTIFWKDSPLHDGAVVVRGGRIAAAGVILPLTNNIAFMQLSGTRHRAAIGISEDTDALALVVSEETGQISMADRGRFSRDLSRQDVEIVLTREFRAGGRSRRAERKAAAAALATPVPGAAAPVTAPPPAPPASAEPTAPQTAAIAGGERAP